MLLGTYYSQNYAGIIYQGLFIIQGLSLTLSSLFKDSLTLSSLLKDSLLHCPHYSRTLSHCPHYLRTLSYIVLIIQGLIPLPACLEVLLPTVAAPPFLPPPPLHPLPLPGRCGLVERDDHQTLESCPPLPSSSSIHIEEPLQIDLWSPDVTSELQYTLHVIGQPRTSQPASRTAIASTLM